MLGLEQKEIQIVFFSRIVSIDSPRLQAQSEPLKVGQTKFQLKKFQGAPKVQLLRDIQYSPIWVLYGDLNLNFHKFADYA